MASPPRYGPGGAYAHLPPTVRARGWAARRLHTLPRPVKRALARRVPGTIDGMKLDLDVGAMLGAAALSGEAQPGDRPLAAERKRFELECLSIDGPPEPVYDSRDFTIAGPGGDIPVRWYAPPPPGDDSSGHALLVHFHGGGHVVGDLDTCESACRTFVNHSGVAVLSVDYRCAPEHVFPAALDDARAAVNWAFAHAEELGVDPERIGVGGDSAGGNLSAALCPAMRDAGEGLPAFQLLIYPAVDIAHRRPSRELFAEGLQLSDAHIDWYRKQYLPREELLYDPAASPLLADSLEGLPPAHIAVVAQRVERRDDGEAYAEALAAAGVPVSLRRHAGLAHGFANYTRVVPAAREAMLETAGALRVLARSGERTGVTP